MIPNFDETQILVYFLETFSKKLPDSQKVWALGNNLNTSPKRHIIT